VRPRAGITERLRQQVARAIASGNRAVSEAADKYRVSWPTAHRALVVATTKWLPEPPPTPWLGIDETRFGSVCWIFGRDYLEAVRFAVDQLRRLLPGWAGIAAVGSLPHRSVCAGLAR
jgi:Helix-turn-helix domain of transposase family ISL3